jgi:trehalose-phosphatase
VADDALQVLEQAEIMLEGRGLGGAMEVKLAGVAVHWRGLPAREVLDIRTKAYRILEPFLAASDLLLADFDEGVELRLRSANKGEAVQRMLRQLPDNVPTAYLGDDTSDEEAFRVLNGRGLTVLVRSKPRFTAAQLWLRPPDELAVFLRNWIRASRGDA